MGKPKVVVLCGSSRFVDIIAVCAWIIEREEKAIAMGLHLLPSWYRSPGGGCPDDHGAEHEGCADEMDALHLRKIDLCDEVFVVNYNSYVGESTARELAYAREIGKPVRWYTDDTIGGIVHILIQNMDEIKKRTAAALFDAQSNDPTVGSMYRAGCIPEEVIVALRSEKIRLMDRVAQLEQISPRKYRLPDGSMAIWRCPDYLIPELVLQAEPSSSAARPPIVCLCGSTRFWQEFQRASLRETMAGKIVLSIGAASGTDDEHFGNLPREEYDRVKAQLDELHLRKIDLADEVLILNVGGYIGESTSRELAYARELGKPVRFLVGDPVVKVPPTGEGVAH